MIISRFSIRGHVAKISFAFSAFAIIATMAAAAMAGPPLSEATKAKLANGHWGGTYGDVWITGPYEKSYNVDPTLSDAAEAKVANGHWSGAYGAVWIAGPYVKPYNNNPQIGQAARSKMSQGYWGGKNGNIWIEAVGKQR